MLTPFDDYPIHQTPVPIAQPVSADPNHYDRYWFNGYERDGRFFVGGAMGHYPNRGVIDGAFSVVHDGVEHSVDPASIHVQTLCKVRMGEKEGVGVLEQLCFGPHEPTGLTGLLDGYSPPAA